MKLIFKQKIESTNHLLFYSSILAQLSLKGTVLLKTNFFLLITFIKIRETKLGFLIPVLDYKFFLYYLKKLLNFYPKLLTISVKLRLTDYQRITLRN